jgi:peptidoglycan/LPS O-acetylase OafA/YrhL
MEELAVQMHDDEFDEKMPGEVSSSRESPGFSYNEFKELSRRMVSNIKLRIRLSTYSSYSPSPKYAKLWLLFCNTTRTLLPSFILPSQGHQTSTRRELHPSAWLDGLRGTAAFFVVIHHSTHAWFSDRVFEGWGSGGDGANKYIIQLPIIRLITSGYPQVAIFFVISGYALSYKPMKLLHSGRSHEFYDSLAMSVFRRHMRLFLPAAGVTLGTAIMTYMNWFGKGGGSREPPHMPSLLEQIWNWACAVMDLAEPFSLRDTVNRFQPAYDPNLWTLPVEFRDSIIVFSTILALSKTRSVIRLSISVGLIVFCLYKTHWDIFLFLSGMLLADLRFRRQEQSEDIQDQNPPTQKSSFSTWKAQNPKYIRAFWIANFVIAVFIVGMPEVGRGAGTSPGFVTLTSLIPQQYLTSNRADLFWIPIAAAHLVFIIDNEKSLQTIFTTSFAQYLGKISFALYMVHGPILYTLGWHWQQKAVGWIGEQTQTRYGLAIALAAVVVFPVIFWVADVVWRLVDAKSVKFVKKLSDRVV